MKTFAFTGMFFALLYCTALHMGWVYTPHTAIRMAVLVEQEEGLKQVSNRKIIAPNMHETGYSQQERDDMERIYQQANAEAGAR